MSAIELTTEQMDAVLTKATEEIRAQAVKNVINSVASSVEWNVKQTLNDEVTAFMRDEVVPEVRAKLVEHKPAIVEAALLAAGDIATALREAMVKAVSERLAENYKRDEILKALFGSRY